jgi:hypothetical protein
MTDLAVFLRQTKVGPVYFRHHGVAVDAATAEGRRATSRDISVVEE